MSKYKLVNDVDSSTESDIVLYLNQYSCPHCEIEWDDLWDCCCNDHCPDCNREIEPYESSVMNESYR